MSPLSSMISTRSCAPSTRPVGKLPVNTKRFSRVRTRGSGSCTSAIQTARPSNSCSNHEQLKVESSSLKALELRVERLCQSTMIFSAEEQFALQLDSEDPLRHFRQKFHLPLGKDDRPLIYFAGNSLGLMPKAARAIVEEELDNWAKLGVDAHHATGTPWYTYHEALREPTARLVGANPLEVICMNSLTVNLHLMMATFYRPTRSRFKILMEEPAFPSDTYAIKTQIAHHGLDPNDALILARPRKNEFTIRTEDIIDLIEKHADQLAVVMLAGVNFFTGQLFDIEKIAAGARKHGIVAGFDLAHAIGNVPLSIHDWNVDFAAWSSYKS